MKKRRLGSSDLELTVIGLGTWAIGGGDWDYGWGPQAEKDSIETVIAALESGINWIDTAAVYGHGVSEEMVGKALKEWGEPVIVATKCSRLKDPSAERGISGNLSKESIFKEAEDSLRRLQIDCIDLYQLHWPDPDKDIEEGFEALMELKQQGKIRYAGVSNFSVSQMERVSKLGDLVSLQPPYSILRRDIEEDILPWCEQNNVGVIVYSPMQCGLLTGKVTKEWVDALPDSDWRKAKNQYFQEPKLSKCIGLTKKLQSLVDPINKQVLELAINWTLRNQAVTSAIVGARNPGQIKQAVKAAEWELDERLLEKIDSLISEFDS